MKDEQLVNKLRSLRVINPPQSTLREVKQRVYQQVQVGSNHSLKSGLFDTVSRCMQSYKFVFYGISFAFVLLVFLSMALIFLPNQFHNVVLYSKLAFASNQYQKSRIVFQDTTIRFGNTTLTRQKTQEFSRSLALANTELSQLKLKGVKGEYSQEECHYIYQEYLIYLKKEEKNIPVNSQAFYSVKSQVNSYQEQAEKKLSLYTSS